MKKTMKKLMVLIMTMMMGISLVVCGGADKQILESYEAHKED